MTTYLIVRAKVANAALKAAFDRLCADPGMIIMDSPEFKRLLKDAGAKLAAEPPANGSSASAH